MKGKEQLLPSQITPVQRKLYGALQIFDDRIQIDNYRWTSQQSFDLKYWERPTVEPAFPGGMFADVGNAELYGLGACEFR